MLGGTRTATTGRNPGECRTSGHNRSILATWRIIEISSPRSGIQERLQKSKDQLPQGLMREVLETYKPNLLTRRRR